MKLGAILAACIIGFAASTRASGQAFAERPVVPRTIVAAAADSVRPEWHGWASVALGAASGRGEQKKTLLIESEELKYGG